MSRYARNSTGSMPLSKAARSEGTDADHGQEGAIFACAVDALFAIEHQQKIAEG